MRSLVSIQMVKKITEIPESDFRQWQFGWRRIFYIKHNDLKKT